MAKLKLPFELEKPSSNEYVTQASEVGYGKGSTKDALDSLKDILPNNERDTLYITDSEGYVVAYFDDEGLKVVDVKAKVSGVLTSLPSRIQTLGSQLSGKVDKVNGKALSTNDYTTEEKNKLAAMKPVDSIEADNAKDTLYLTDSNGNIVAKFDKDGLTAIEVQARGRKLTDAPLSLYEDLYVTDANGYVVMKVDSDGVKAVGVSYPGMPINDWKGKRLATYGDSVTAVNNGDFTYPYNLSGNSNYNWANVVANYFYMSKQYGRGIGGQGYKWGTAAGSGGSVSWVTPTGVLINRLDSFNYDNWDGQTYPSGVTASMEQQGTAIRIRGCLASWLRITKMFPASIKDNIDVVLVMAHNDSYETTDCTFVANDTTDTEWAASGNDYYGKIGGDYNLNTFKGAVASTVMKLQMWMPNAIIVLMSGISGQGASGQINTEINSPSGLNKAEAVRLMSKITSIPCIDTYASDGINGWNRLSYIADSIHPYTVKGRNMFARAVIGGLKVILSNI